jgi:predicted permease
MTLFNRGLSVLRWVLYRTRAEQHLSDEINSFVDMCAADKIRDGVPAAEARRQAIVELGGIEQAKERVRTYRHGAWLDEIGRDVRYAFRLFVKNPAFSVIVVITLALGIGANTAIFSLIDALMLRWLPVPHPEQLVQVRLQAPGDPGPGGDSFSYVIARALADRREIFTDLAGFSSFSVEVGSSGSITRVPAALVTGGFYRTLGLSPVVGRLLTREDDEPGAPLVAVISYGYWQRQLAASPEAVGRTVSINNHPVTIVGVSPRGFVGATVGLVADITMTVAALPQLAPAAAPLLGPGNFWLRILGRPVAGMSTEQASARLNAAWLQLSESVIASHWPASRRKAMAESRFQLTAGGTGWSYLRELYKKPLIVLMAIVGLVLLIACANVASLLLARSSAQQREIAVRLAIGAARGRIVRQFLIESTVLSLIGAAFGVGLAWVSSRLLVGLISNGPASIEFDLSPNWHILGFTIAVSVATALLFGVAPAIHATRSHPSRVLRADSKVIGSRSRLLPALVSAQVALALVLLAGAALFVRTLANLQTLDRGFETEGVLLADLEGRRTPVPPDLLDDVKKIPHVLSASLSTHTPLSGSVWSEPAVPAGQPVPEKDNAFFVGAGPGFFKTMQIPLRSGRAFTDRDRADGPAVAIVNETYASRFLANRNPVGERLSASVRGQRRELEIVGLAGNTSAAGLRRPSPPTVYVAYAQLTGDFPTTLTVRASGQIGQVSAAMQQALESKFPGTPIDIRSLSTQVAATLSQERLMATLAGAFGMLALTLACVGLYGLLAYSVAQRTKEIGLRMALGAQRTRVVAAVLKHGTMLVSIGIALGLPAVWAASRWVDSMLFGVTTTDPAATIAAILVLTAAAQLAAYLPARRASRVDPLVALKQE